MCARLDCGDKEASVYLSFVLLQFNNSSGRCVGNKLTVTTGAASNGQGQNVSSAAAGTRLKV